MSKKNTINKDEGQIIPHLLDSTSDYNNFATTKAGLQKIHTDIIKSMKENDSWSKDANDNPYMIFQNTTNYTISIQFYYTDYVQGTEQYLGTKSYVASEIPPHSNYFIYEYPSSYNYDYSTSVSTEWEVTSVK